MDILKKNIVSLLCGVVALLAIISLFWPLGGMFESLDTAANERKSVHDQLNGLLTKSRTLPILDPRTAESTPLKVFPNRAIIDEGDRKTKEVAQQSRDAFQALVDINMHRLLVPGSLPSPDSQAIPYLFRDAYGKEMGLTIPNDVLHAGIPPTELEIKAAQDKLLEEVYKPKIIEVNGAPINSESVMAEFMAAAAKVPAQLKQSVADRSKVYMNADALTVNKELLNPTAPRPDPIDIWWAQVGAWVQRDICEAIAMANRDSTGISNSVVKHLIKLEMPVRQFLGVAPLAPGAPPVAVDPSAPPPKVFSISPTGRVSNPMYDVMQFKLQVNVDAARLPALFTELSRNRLITVTRVNNIVTVDPVMSQATGYYYGKEPVIQVTLEGEVILLRKWTEPYMPGRIKRMLGIPEAAPTPAGQ